MGNQNKKKWRVQKIADRKKFDVVHGTYMAAGWRWAGVVIELHGHGDRGGAERIWRFPPAKARFFGSGFYIVCL